MADINESSKCEPSQILQHRTTNAEEYWLVNVNNKERWENGSQAHTPHSFSHLFLRWFFWINRLLWILLLPTVLGQEQRWDGVAVTESNLLALQALKQEFIDPVGYLRSWNDSGYGACSGGWVGIKCAQGQVIAIKLPWKGLKGQITERIGELQRLRKLSIHDNQIGGSIPSALGLLPYLRGVQLFNNLLTGTIPLSLGYCPFLQSLDLSNNLLTGTIPHSLANSTKLQRLILDHNFFTENIPASLGNLGQLRVISLSHNQLSGAIPSEIGTLSRLKTLDISNNALNGSLPASFSNLTSLTHLNAENNNLDNHITEALGRLGNLSALILSRNKFSGHVPTSLANIPALTLLDLSLNNLSGEIPASFETNQRLNLFNVSYNSLSGSVPILLARKFNSSSFMGNIQLCGYSRSTPCPWQSQPGGEVIVPHPKLSTYHHHKKLGTIDIILIAAGVLLVLLVTLSGILLFCLVKKRDTSKVSKVRGVRRGTAMRRTQKGVPPFAEDIGEVEEGREAGGKLVYFDGSLAFTPDDLLCATAEIMGKSSYGTVYKATLEDGSQVCVKRLREKITKSQREFESEVSVLARIRHPNVLPLRAYYLGPKGEKLLVFDYMPIGSLASFLHDRGPETAIDWPTRRKIAQDIARGLWHLHSEANIVHGNLTSSNVLLDENVDAKVADFGLSLLVTTSANSNMIASTGALGYRAPELSKLKKANTKTDIYNLGVILLELLTRKSPAVPTNRVDLPQWVSSIVKAEWTNEVFDAELMKDASIIGDELLNTLKLALQCVDPAPSARPEAQQVLQQLEEMRPEESVSSDEDF